LVAPETVSVERDAHRLGMPWSLDGGRGSCEALVDGPGQLTDE
jgi:hypothetical protein